MKDIWTSSGVSRLRQFCNQGNTKIHRMNKMMFKMLSRYAKGATRKERAEVD